MAKDKTATKKEEAKVKKGKETTADDAAKLAKKEARKEALKNRPEGQRPNSKQIDVIYNGDHGKIEVFGATIRKIGVLVTTVALDPKGNIIAVGTTLVPGVKVKSKKGHGALQPGVAGEGKKKKGGDTDTEEGDED